jgi:hypothetical protein
LTLGEAARIIREAVKDKSYRSTPLGQLVGRYLRWFRNEYGATESTLRDYEAVLARMSLTLADKEPIDVSVDDLRDVIDLWGERSPRTRQKVTSVVRAFWSWTEEQGHTAIPPRHGSGAREPRNASHLFCRPTHDRGSSRSRSTRATASRSSVCCSSASGEASWPASRSATSMRSAAPSASTARAGKSGSYRSAGLFSPSFGSSSAAISPTSAGRPSRTTTSSTRPRRSTTDAALKASRSAPSGPTRRSAPALRLSIAGGTASSKRPVSSAAGSRTG